MPVTPASSIFAQHLTGDLGGMTFVQKAGIRRTSYAKTYPVRKPSGTQTIFRARFSAAVRAWQALDADHKQTLELICLQHRMVMSGFNLFISCTMNRRMSWIEEWSQQLNRTW